MANFEYNYNQNDYEIIKLAETVGNLTVDGAYLRLSILDNDGNLFQNSNENSIFFATLSETDLTIQRPSSVTNLENLLLNKETSDFIIYENVEDNSIYIKPNEILNSNNIPQGTYTLKLDFLKQYQPKNDAGLLDNFIVKEVSTSRLEIRLKLLNNDITQIGLDSLDVDGENWLSDFKTSLGNVDSTGNFTNNFKHVLNIGQSVTLPIVNVAFDNIKDGENNQSLILKLYEKVPNNFTNLQLVTIDEEILITQTQDVTYFSDVEPTQDGQSLKINEEFDFGYTDIGTQTFENLDTLSGSLGNDFLDNITTGSYGDYKNLNIDYRFFKNHAILGSAKSKIENFKTKVERIQSYYSEISSSLVVSSSTSNDFKISLDTSEVTQLRQNYFSKIRDELNTFTPFEKFLYYDAQTTSTASAPGLKNYASTIPVSNEVNTNFRQLNNANGFDVIFEHSSKGVSEGEPIGGKIDLFSKKYFVHDKPFFNYKSPVYLSFLLKGRQGINLHYENTNQDTTLNGLPNQIKIPDRAFASSSILNPSITGSEYRRFIFQASQSYWSPTDVVNNDIQNINDFNSDSNEIEVFSGSTNFGLTPIKDTSGKYPITVISQSNDGESLSGFSFTGSCSPAGELFNIYYNSSSLVVSQSLITDVEVTLNNPLEVLPFDNLYHTSSTTWQSWYDGTLASASAYDSTNIHSLENNLPNYIQNSSDYTDFKKFLNLIGEQFDLIRNYIDNFSNYNKRNYDEIESVPSNLLPILIDNMGWEAIQPFTSSLQTYFNSQLSGQTDVKTIEDNTWRKTLNNLIYLYKSKGTKNSVRALLNIYGYPGDVLSINEFGGSTQPQNDVPISPATPTIGTTTNDTNLVQSIGNVSFETKKDKFFTYNFSNDSTRILKTDWWMDNAKPNTLEFVYKHETTTNTQTLFKSSGSGNETLWDLRLLPSTTGASSSFQFRLNNSKTGSLAIATNAVSMSTNFLEMTNGSLWNIMLQRMTSSLNGQGTNRYQILAATQKGSRIEEMSFISMSISGGIAEDKNHVANDNWYSSGSRHFQSSSNLIIGETTSGSMAEIRTWDTALSMSKFRLHTLNKFSSIGNTIESYTDELIYHFRLNENHNSSSVSSSATINIIDSNILGPLSNPTNYSFTMPSDIATGSLLYNLDLIQTNIIGIQDSTQNKINDNKIIVKPDISFQNNLSPILPSVQGPNKKSYFNQGKVKPDRINSTKLELKNSPQEYVNNFILQKIQSFNLENLYGNPLYNYSSSYDDLKTFRDKFYKNYPIKIDTNKFIRIFENVYNESLIVGLEKLLPVRSSLLGENNKTGVTIKPTILEKQKIKYQDNSVEINPGLVSGSIDMISSSSFKTGFSLTQDINLPSSGSVSVVNTISKSFGVELPKSGSISVNNQISESFSIVLPKSGSISIVNAISKSSNVERPVSSSINIPTQISKSFSLDLPKSSSISIVNTISKSFNIELPISNSINVVNEISKSFNIILPKSASISIINNISKSFNINLPKSASLLITENFISSSGEIILPVSGTNNFINTNYTKTFENIHDSWGRGDNNTHFLNMATLTRDTSSNGDYNVNHVETRNHFYTIGDVEIYSSSKESNDDFSNVGKFHNRINIKTDVHEDTIYESLIFGNPGNQTGRAIGKTRYFLTGSDGSITLPANHVRKFSNPFVDRMYEGAQNVNPGIMQLDGYRDLSTASFYRVRVTGGENKLIIKYTNPDKEGKNNLI